MLAELVKRVLVTTKLSDRRNRAAQKAGIEAIELPLIETQPKEVDWESLASTLATRRIVLTSPKAGRLLMSNVKGLAAHPYPLVAVGKGTESILNMAGLKADTPPEPMGGRALAEWMIRTYPPPHEVAHVGGSRRHEAFRERLQAAGWKVEEIDVYDTLFCDLPENLPQQVEAVCFLSPSAVEQYYANNLQQEFSGIPVIAIGDTTAKALRANGAQPLVSPDTDINSMFQFVRDSLAKV